MNHTSFIQGRPAEPSLRSETRRSLFASYFIAPIRPCSLVPTRLRAVKASKGRGKPLRYSPASPKSLTGQPLRFSSLLRSLANLLLNYRPRNSPSPSASESDGDESEEDEAAERARMMAALEQHQQSFLQGALPSTSKLLHTKQAEKVAPKPVWEMDMDDFDDEDDSEDESEGEQGTLSVVPYSAVARALTSSTTHHSFHFPAPATAASRRLRGPRSRFGLKLSHRRVFRRATRRRSGLSPRHEGLYGASRTYADLACRG